MANVTLWGASYTGVGYLGVPRSGGGEASYFDVTDTTAVAADVAQGKLFHLADGTLATGTSVPTQDSTLVVTVSWNDQTEMWEPDCTWSEIAAAASTGKTIIMAAPLTDNATADCLWDDDNSIFFYCVFSGPDSASVVQIIYVLTEESLEVDYYNEITQPTGTINITQAGNTDVTQYATASVPYADEYAAVIGSDDQFVTITNQRYWQARARFLVDSPGWVSGDVAGDWQRYSAVPANTTITPSTSVQTVGGSKYMMEGAVTVAAMPSGSVSASASKGSVSNHSVSVTPTVTVNTAGYLAAGSTSGTAVTVSASELVSGSQTVTTNDTYDVTNLAELVVDVQGGGSSGMQVATTTATPSTASSSISFTGLSGQPTSFYLTSAADLATGAAPYKVAAVTYDGTDMHGQIVTNTSNAQASYSTAFAQSYSGGTLTVSSTGANFQAVQYRLVYTYGGTSANVGTAETQVGSGATSVTFTGLTDEPTCFSVVFKSDFSTSSGYQRVIAVTHDGSSTYGLAMDSAANAQSSWSYTYSNGSLTVASQGTNNGGYFHQPGYYQLTYGIGGEAPEIDIEPLTVTQNGVYSESGKAYSPVTVNVSGGGSVQTDTKTATASDYPTSLQFTSMKGEPKMFTVRLNTSVSSSGSTTYYYIVNITSHGTTTHGDVFRIGSTRQVNSVTSGYSWSYSGTTLTITSSAASRSASPGAFYSGSYELMYVY